MQAFADELPSAKIAVVDNGSSDATAEIVSALCEQMPERYLLLREERRGKANAVRKALSEIDADIYVLADADSTYPARAVHDLIALVSRYGYDMAVGDRGVNAGEYSRENTRFAHVFGNRFVVGLINKLFGARLSDVMSGYRVFDRRFAALYPALVDGFELEVDMTVFALTARLSIREMPVAYKDRPMGSASKLHTLRDGWRVVRNIFSILRHYRPMYFFGGMGIIFGMLGLICGSVPVDDYLKARYVSHVPLALLAVGLVMTSAMCISTGLILSTVTRWGRISLEQRIRKYSRDKAAGE